MLCIVSVTLLDGHAVVYLFKAALVIVLVAAVLKDERIKQPDERHDRPRGFNWINQVLRVEEVLQNLADEVVCIQV